MSLICGALKWLKDGNERDRIEAEEILKGQRRFVHVYIMNATTTW